MTTPGWGLWGLRPSCRLLTCSWETSECSAASTSSGRSTLSRDTMHSHARYCVPAHTHARMHTHTHTPVCMSCAPVLQALCEALKKWQEVADPSGKKRRRRDSSERCYIDFLFEHGTSSLSHTLSHTHTHTHTRAQSCAFFQAQLSSPRGCSSWRRIGEAAEPLVLL